MLKRVIDISCTYLAIRWEDQHSTHHRSTTNPTWLVKLRLDLFVLASDTDNSVYKISIPLKYRCTFSTMQRYFLLSCTRLGSRHFLKFYNPVYTHLVWGCERLTSWCGDLWGKRDLLFIHSTSLSPHTMQSHSLWKHIWKTKAPLKAVFFFGMDSLIGENSHHE